jgi:hypothetical protein
LVHAHPGTTEVLDGLVPARHTVVAPPSSARCRARRGRQASRRERPLPCPPSSASTALYRGVPTAPSACTDSMSAGPPAIARPHCAARASLAALQGGQAGAHPDQTKARTAGAVRLNLSFVKTATSPANRGGS